MFGKKFNNTGSIEYIIAGLGNPGAKYEFTRHNIGFMFVDYWANKESKKISKLKYKSLISEVTISGHKCLIMKPQTYMNNSGEAIREAADFYKIPPEKVIVIYDDISFDVGKIRIRRKGSAGGHNGIKSIIQHLGSDNFPRIKIGAGKKPENGFDQVDWVLSHFSKDELETLRKSAEKVCEVLPLMVEDKIDEAMNKANT